MIISRKALREIAYKIQKPQVSGGKQIAKTDKQSWHMTMSLQKNIKIGIKFKGSPVGSLSF